MKKQLVDFGNWKQISSVQGFCERICFHMWALWSSMEEQQACDWTSKLLAH